MSRIIKFKNFYPLIRNNGSRNKVDYIQNFIFDFAYGLKNLNMVRKRFLKSF